MDAGTDFHQARHMVNSKDFQMFTRKPLLYGFGKSRSHRGLDGLACSGVPGTNLEAALSLWLSFWMYLNYQIQKDFVNTN